MKGNFKFILILFFLFFGSGVMALIGSFDYNVNKTGIIYQENDNIVLSEVNKTYNHSINYDLEESYLHYSPVKKTGFLDSFHKSKNLASPNLEAKEYLGDGVYRIKFGSNYTLDYNVFNGIWTLNANNLTQTVFITLILDKQFTDLGDNTLTYIYVSGTSAITSSKWLGWQNPRHMLLLNYNNQSLTSVNTTQNRIDLVLYTGDILTNFQFKLQLEKGDTATDYQVPYIPALKIDFDGSNQVEFINPYQEHIIKINDINNVNNIKFDLLNTDDNVLFNWNIKTNENLPFLRYYNEENKLLYDFTDIDEINLIGNTLMVDTSSFTEIVDSALTLVDLFYTGFQKLFLGTKSTIKTIFDNLLTTGPFFNFPVA